LGRGFEGAYTARLSVGADGRPEAGEKEKTKEPKLFIALFKNSQGAINALKYYRSDLANKGKVQQFKSNTLRGEDGYRGEVLVVQRGSYLLGAVGFEKEEARIRMDELMRNVK
jgi:hypothetical protein